MNLRSIFNVKERKPINFRVIKEKAKELCSNILKECRKNIWTTCVVSGYSVIILLDIYYLAAFYVAFYWLDDRMLPANSVYLGLLMVFNMLLFFCSSMCPVLNYNNIKTVLLGINYFTICIGVIAKVFHSTSIQFFYWLFTEVPISPFVSAALLIWCARWVEALICGAFIYGFIRLFMLLLENKVVMKEILFFRLDQYMDFRKNKKYLYDLNLGRDTGTGISIKVLEKDRWLHQLDDGASGSGKTSLVMLKGIAQDLDTRQRNERKQKKIVYDMLDENQIFRYREEDDFNINDFYPYPSHRQQFEEVKRTYRVAGITFMAPDDSGLDKVYQLAKARGVSHINRIDPRILENEQYKEDFIGYNPFYIEPELIRKQNKAYVVKVNQRASIYRDVMQKLYEMDGKSDSYFTGVNKTTNYNMSMLCILTYPFLHGRQANPVDSLMELLSLRPIEVEEEKEYEDKNGAIKKRKHTELYPNPKLLDLLTCFRQSCSEEVVKSFSNSILIFFETEFVENPKRGLELFNQSLGLRNLVNDFVNNPILSPILTAPDDRTFVISRALERGEITLFNFYQEMGDSMSRTFGLFFLLNFDAEVKARPGTEDTRLPHFLRLDELPVILHPIVNSQISLYRKFRVSCEYAIQSLSQMEENQATKFLAGSLKTVGTHIVFGRAGLEEMKVYEQMSGIKMVDSTRYGYAEGSIWSDQSQTQNIQTTAMEGAAMSGSDIRYRNFGECTLFLVRNGVPAMPRVTRFEFLNESAYESKVGDDDIFPLKFYRVMPIEEDDEVTDMYEETGISVEVTKEDTGSRVTSPVELIKPQTENNSPAADTEKAETASEGRKPNPDDMEDIPDFASEEAMEAIMDDMYEGAAEAQDNEAAFGGIHLKRR